MALKDDLRAIWELSAASGNETDLIGSKVATASGAIGSASGLWSMTARDLEADDNRQFQASNHADFQIDGDFSIAIWSKRESNGTARVISKAVSNFEWSLQSDASSVYFYITTDGDFANRTTASRSHTADTNWHHFAAGYVDSAELIWVAIDGNVTTASYTAAIHVSTNALRIGQFYDGLLQQAAFWKRDIRSDLAAIYNGGAGLPYSQWDAVAKKATGHYRRMRAA